MLVVIDILCNRLMSNQFLGQKPTLAGMGHLWSVPNIYECINCKKVYHHKKTLSRHIRQECGVEPVLSCPHCPYKARRAYVLASHVKSHRFIYPSINDSFTHE